MEKYVQPVIHVEGLVRKYGATTAVDGISFDISGREVVGFLGPNGAGKTTTLKVLAGYLYPSGGIVKIGDRDVTESPLDCRRMIGYLPENNPLYEDMEVYEYLSWCASMRQSSDPNGALREVVRRCGLQSVISKDIVELSKGYRQRVGLAAAMIHNPPILLLDEPTSGLDPNQALEMRRLISELRKEKTVLYSSHILSEVRASCDRVIIIHQGRIVAQGRPEELTESASQEQRIHLVLRSNGFAEKDVCEKLLEFSGVKSADPAGGKDGEAAFELVVGPEGGDLREKIFKLAVKQKWPLLELRRETMSLEQVFRSLTA